MESGDPQESLRGQQKNDKHFVWLATVMLGVTLTLLFSHVDSSTIKYGINNNNLSMDPLTKILLCVSAAPWHENMRTTDLGDDGAPG